MNVKKIRAFYVNTLILSFALLISSASAVPLSHEQIALIAQLPIKNISHPEKQHFAAGQPSRKDIKALADLGLQHVINLRPTSEQIWDEERYVRSLGMQYHSIPVAGISGLNKENAHKLSRLLQQLSNEPLLVHCYSGNRVGALIALDQKNDIKAAIAEGKRWGLSRLEPVVRNKLMPY